MPNLAEFDIIGSVGGTSPASDAGFDMVHDEELTFRLSDAASLVREWTIEVYDATNELSPRASKSAPELELNGLTTGQAVRATTPSSDITTTAPSSGVHSYLVRSKVNGGNGPEGTPHSDYIFERIIAIRSPIGYRKILNGEAAQYEAESWAEAFNEIVDSLSAGAAVAALVSFDDDGLTHVTGNSVQEALESADAAIDSLTAPAASAVTVDDSGLLILEGADVQTIIEHADQLIDGLSVIAASEVTFGPDGLNYVSGANVQAALESVDAALLAPPANPADDGKVALASGGDLVYGTVGTAQLSADAVDGTKIADGAVDTEHLAADAVGTTELADDAVTAAKSALDIEDILTEGSDANGQGVENLGAIAGTGSFKQTPVSNSDGWFSSLQSQLSLVNSSWAAEATLDADADHTFADHESGRVTWEISILNTADGTRWSTEVTNWVFRDDSGPEGGLQFLSQTPFWTFELPSGSDPDQFLVSWQVTSNVPQLRITHYFAGDTLKITVWVKSVWTTNGPLP